jgi:hypothetical protein
MDHFAGLDVSVYETGVCFVDDTARPTAQMRFRPLVRLPQALAALSLTTAQRVSTWTSVEATNPSPVAGSQIAF